MSMLLGISTVLGVIGVVSAFGLFYLGERVFHLDRPHIQTLMYLRLSVVGHLTIFLTRTRDWAVFVWGCHLVWFLVNDRVKLLVYRVFDPTTAPLLPRKLTPKH